MEPGAAEQEFNGTLYTQRDDGYLRSADGAQTYLHRDVYEHYFGAIPDEHDIHHVDDDSTNNQPDNLVARPRDEHRAEHNAERRAQLDRTTECDYCGTTITDESFGGQRRWCDSTCRLRWCREQSQFYEECACEVCGATYERFYNSTRQTCSSECARELQADTVRAFSDEKARDIQRRYPEETLTEIADDLDTSTSTVHNIVHGKNGYPEPQRAA